MALINCKECGKDVSTEATSCPHCGYKQPKKSVLPVVAAWVGAIIIPLIAASYINRQHPEVEAQKYEQATADCSLIGAKIALPGGDVAGSGEKAINAIEDCMSSRGFPVKLRK